MAPSLNERITALYTAVSLFAKGHPLELAMGSTLGAVETYRRRTKGVEDAMEEHPPERNAALERERVAIRELGGLVGDGDGEAVVVRGLVEVGVRVSGSSAAAVRP